MNELPLELERTLLFAGGGTGGHVFPMIAVATRVQALAPDVRLVFVGTARGIEARAVPQRGYELELLDVLPLRGGGVGGFAARRDRARSERSAPARALVEALEPAPCFPSAATRRARCRSRRGLAAFRSRCSSRTA